eukprot:3810609-Rhodomonas_salina.3
MEPSTRCVPLEPLWYCDRGRLFHQDTTGSVPRASTGDGVAHTHPRAGPKKNNLSRLGRG